MGEVKRAKKKLSTSILEMKFMKKSREAAMTQLEDEEGRAVFASELTEAMKLGGIRCIMEPSFVPCEDLGETRRSYHGMNPEIEMLLAEKRAPVVKEEEDVDFRAEEVALATSMARKFKKSLQPPRKKTKFLKPSDD